MPTMTPIGRGPPRPLYLRTFTLKREFICCVRDIHWIIDSIERIAAQKPASTVENIQFPAGQFDLFEGRNI